jgi:hypothetical protein
VAAELTLNADVVAVCEPHGSARSPAEVGSTLETQQWDKHQSELTSLRSWDAELLADTQQIYRALKLTKARGALPPLAADLRALSERLAATKV